MTSNKLYRLIYGALITGGIIVVLPLIVYWYNFRDSSFSDDPAQWGQFSDYLNVFVSIASLFLISALTYIIHQNELNNQNRFRELEEKASADKEEIEKLRNRPLIIFKVNPKTRKWVIKNVGIGAALNVKLSFTDVTSGWNVPVKIYSFSSGEELELHFHIAPFKLCAVYYDIHQNVISSIGEGDDTTFIFDKDELEEYKDHYVRLDEMKQNSVQWHVA